MTMPKHTISLALITRNEETCLDRCLGSFKSVADEIVVVDTGSTDRTKEIARKYTDKVYDFKWIDDFSAARNFSFDKCTCDFIFWVDADDYILPEDAEKVRQIDLSDKEIIIFNYEYAHDEFGNSLSTVPRERMVRRSLGLRWEEEIHEYLQLNGKLWISGISTHHNKKAGTSERNLKILERVVAKNPDKSRNIYYIGREYLDFGRTEEGIKYLEKFVTMPGAFWEDVYLAHYRLAEVFIKDENKFREHLFKSMMLEERRAEPFFLFGQFWEGKQQWERAIQWFECCLAVHRPKELLACYQPDFYTWKPCLELCVCYNAIGNLQKALEYNERALGYRPKDERMLNNRKILVNGLKERKKERKDGQGKKFNLGCGNKAMPGHVNVDIVKTEVTDELFEFDEMPYADGTAGVISSEHALEHVGYERIDRTLKEWFRVLRPSGQLFLKIPDLAECCKGYLASADRGETINGIPAQVWYKNTIYGIQKSQAGEPDEAQYHKWGFSKKEICEKLKDTGFIIDYAENYDGWKTPSVAVLAVKPVSDLKIGWISSYWVEAAQNRIRDIRISRWLKSRGYRAEIVLDYPQILAEDYDVCIFGRDFSENGYNQVKRIKAAGKTVIADLCESLFEFAWVAEMIKLSDLAICCSRELERQVREKTGVPTVVIEDAFE